MEIISAGFSVLYVCQMQYIMRLVSIRVLFVLDLTVEVLLLFTIREQRAKAIVSGTCL